MKKYAVLDIGGTQIKYGVIDQQGELLWWKQEDTNAQQGGLKIIETVILLIQDIQKDTKLCGVGISTAGVVDSVKGKIVYANSNIPGYTGIEVKEMIENAVHLPCEVENDVSCAGLCEAHCGAGKGYHHVACITIGTGIGGSLVIDGHVYHGGNHCAGEIGYIPIFNSTLEQEASMSALLARVNQKREKGYELDGKAIFQKALQNDLLCQQEVDRMCQYIGTGLACLSVLMNPEIIVIGGGVSAQGEWFRKKIEGEFMSHSLPNMIQDTKVALAQKGNQAGMIGAWIHFIQTQGGTNERV